MSYGVFVSPCSLKNLNHSDVLSSGSILTSVVHKEESCHLHKEEEVFQI
jgi:hypothetical protein